MRLQYALMATAALAITAKTESTTHRAPETAKSIDEKSNSTGIERTSMLNLSPDGDRVQFQIQGHQGPRSYVFGYDTGRGSNRQFRLEERATDGTVRGQYGYYDARGKLRTIRYVARPFLGYQERHHESNRPRDHSV